ncbi:MAG: trypsin-like peptidase domain-containing protein [Chloroflexi bacterium]|nr:trypsin-like peptidase domain-containing protein [Chloroflexota bacterium]
MGLLKLGSAALVGSALTLAVVAGPTHIAETVRQAAQPVTSTASGVASSLGTDLSSLVGQTPRPGLTTPGNPAIVAAPAVAQQPATAPVQPVQQVGASTETTVRVYQDNRPSVVTVISSAVAPGFRSEPQPNGTGSGFVIDNQGHILTNNHVVAEADKLEVTLSDGTTYTAKLIGRDARFDLAVIQADIPADKLRTVKLGDSDALQVGEQVVAIGNPYGLDGTVTTGVVSGRRPLVSEPSSEGILVNAIQTDTSINPGNSGGPLMNARGEVIGVTTLGLMPNGGQAGLNFAIPINNAKKILNDLMANGSYKHPFVGIATAEITESVAQQLNLPVKQGLLVQSVEASSAAGQAGLRAGTSQQQAGARQVATGGDIITAVDGRQLARPEEFVAYLAMNKKAGETITLTVLRDGKQQDLTLTLGERPVAQEQQNQQRPSQQQPGQPRQQPGRQTPGSGNGNSAFPSFPLPGGR